MFIVRSSLHIKTLYMILCVGVCVVYENLTNQNPLAIQTALQFEKVSGWLQLVSEREPTMLPKGRWR